MAKIFTEGERLNPEALPTWMHTTEMKQAMSTLKAQLHDQGRTESTPD